jgi:hypothetical protein
MSAPTPEMSASLPEITFTPRASGDGTWYVEVASPGLAYEDVGDFRSKESAEAWIRNSSEGYAARRTTGSGAGATSEKATDEAAL